MRYYIKGNYYFDIDAHNQLRVTGPENHLLIGIPFPQEVAVSVADYHNTDDENLIIELECDSKHLEIPMPLVTDVRTLRHYTEQTEKRILYQTLSANLVTDLLPQTVRKIDSKTLELLNAYEDEGQQKEYGTTVQVPNGTIESAGNVLTLKTTENALKIIVTTLGNIRVAGPFPQLIFAASSILPESGLPSGIYELYSRVKSEIEHLVLTKKTSSLEYDTIFPRDWIESADLGEDDFTQETIEYMYEQSMKHVSETGEGWHEDIVGSYQAKNKDIRLHIDRKMIDIEPHYLLGTPQFSSVFRHREDIKQKLQHIAKYVMHNAQKFSLITFKRLDEYSPEYHHVGNWRDSYLAFTEQMSPLAPYDVNCVFYPTALRILFEYSSYFDVDEKEVADLIEKWDTNKIKYRLYHNGYIGYSLAIHGKKGVPLPVAHLDESYDLFYGVPSMEEVVSFAHKIVDPDYFYTPVGPLLVSSDDRNFSTKEYHGKVIWPKQAAFAVAGLAKQFYKGVENNWPSPVLEEIKSSALITAEACFRGWSELNAVPELYYYDEVEDRARLYTDQSVYEGQMSIIQLWSAVGCRRIIRDYVWLKHHAVG
ncbi:MAG: hypothetical protein WAU07_02075 [Microgenomates group bacterium]